MDPLEIMLKAFVATIVAIIFMALIAAWVTPSGRMAWNEWFFNVQKADDATSYKTIKEVEDTCRAMISSYTSDKLTWQQYCMSDSPEKQSWAEQAKMRANKTASSYNHYILKNSFVWEGNIPDDIKMELEYLPERS